MSNPYAKRCVDLNASSVSSVPLKVTDDKGNEVKDEKHPLVKLLKHPNPRMNGKKFFEKVMKHLGIHGNAYICIVRRSGNIEGLHPIHPHRVTPNFTDDALNPIASWVVNLGDSVKTVPVEDMIHIAYYDADDTGIGISPMVSAAWAIEIQNEIREWNLATARNCARPSMKLTIPDELSEEKFKDLKRRLNEGCCGADNAGKIMVLDGGKDAVPTGFTAMEMDYRNAQEMYAREIATAYGVPPEKIGDIANKTYANSAEANREYAIDTVIPLLDTLCSALNLRITPAFDDAAEITYDHENVPGLLGDRARQLGEVNDIHFISFNEKREAFGYGSIGPAGDVLMVPADLKPLNNEISGIPADDDSL
ncbi:MAG: phage portal protein [Methanomassiliicoccaceae archaeon]|nr:phage portal protein [Methanomassiliicoccaceae archaeon]